MVVHGLDGTVTTYDEVNVEGDSVERLLTALFTENWPAVTVGPLIEGAAYEIRFTVAPKVSMLDGYMTIDTGAWHFHLCVGDHRGTPSPELGGSAASRAAPSSRPRAAPARQRPGASGSGTAAPSR